MPVENSQTPEKEPTKIEEKISRRGFLKKVAMAGAFLAGVGVFGRDTLTPNRRMIPEPLREDLLSEEELRKAHIKIYQTPQTKLYLRRGVFDFPLFKDAQEGEIKEIVIVLVDHPSLSWNASEKMPTDPRIVFQANYPHPRERPEEYWQKKEEEEEGSLEAWTRYKKNDQGTLERLLSEEEEKKVREEIAFAQKYSTSGFNREYWQKRAKELEEELQEILSGKRREEIEKGIRRDDYWINQTERELAILRDRPRAIAREAETTNISGAMIPVNPAEEISQQKAREKPPEVYKRWLNLLENHPQLHNKMFLYLVVGGELKPHPKQSYPSPEQFREYPWIQALTEEEKPRYYRWAEPSTPGESLRHEVFHYRTEGKSVDEYEADTRVFDSIVSAWEKYKITGDSSGYPFVFVTKGGITVTKQLEKKGEEKIGEV